MNLTTKTLKTLTFTTGFLAILSVGFFGASAVLADTEYIYVTASGDLATEVADTPMEAINEATDIKYNSGVIEADELMGLDNDMTVMADTDMEADTYLYVDEDGDLDVENADTPREAINEADDIKFNSGVIDAESYFALATESNTEVTTSDTNDEAYYYVTADGELALETADTPREAINEANDIRYNSGVITVEAYMELSE